MYARLKLIVAAMVTAGMTVASSQVAAEDYPTRPVKIIVPSSPGGTTDIAARLLANGLSQKLGQTFIVENKGGASGNIGITEAAQANPDGYTLLVTYSGYQVNNPSLFKTLAWDPVTSFAPVALALNAPHVILVNKDLPVSTLAEFVDYAKEKAGSVTYASSGPGSIQHIGAEQLSQLTGIKMVHVPYRGAAPALTDLIAGSVNLFITTPPSAVGHIQSGAVKALAVAAASRNPLIPDVPTTKEAGVPGLDLTAWFAMYAPAGTDQNIIDRLASEIKDIVESESFKAQAGKQGAYAEYLGPHELGDFTKREIVRWGEIIQKAHISVD